MSSYKSEQVDLYAPLWTGYIRLIPAHYMLIIYSNKFMMNFW